MFLGNKSKNKIFFFMYKKNEILEIFNSVQTYDELTAVCEAFKWLMDNEFLAPSQFLFEKSLEAFSRVT